ncbi:MAG: hypothetical protein H0T73_03835 [Ardenticatenales bacterium]|nr:hypothetical protein [Ardenticatenales bacterium]
MERFQGFENFETHESNKVDETIHQNLRRIDGPPPETEQTVGAPESEVFRQGDSTDPRVQEVEEQSPPEG